LLNIDIAKKAFITQGLVHASMFNICELIIRYIKYMMLKIQKTGLIGKIVEG
jgi:hypothetical protein